MKKLTQSFLFCCLLLVATISRGQTIRDTTRIIVGDSTVVTVKTTTNTTATANIVYSYPVITVTLQQYKIANSSTSPNLPPLVNAGNNQTIYLPGSSVTLSGSATDPDGSITSTIWTKTAGNGGVISNATALTTTVTGLTAGFYVFRLTASDNSNASSSANTTVTVLDTSTLPTPNGKLLIDNNFEGPNPFVTNGGNWLSDNQYCCSYSITQSTAIFHEGKASYRMEIRPNDPQSSGGRRAEIEPKKCLDGSDYADQGDMWYGWSMYIDSPTDAGFSTDGYGKHYIQWHPNNSSGSAEFSFWPTAQSTLDVTINPTGSGSVTHQNKQADGSALMKFPGKTWINFVAHIDWTKGIAQVWVNGKLYFDKNGISWLQNAYLKFGTNTFQSFVATLIIYYDNLRIGRNTASNPIGYSDVAPK